MGEWLAILYYLSVFTGVHAVILQGDINGTRVTLAIILGTYLEPNVPCVYVGERSISQSTKGPSGFIASEKGLWRPVWWRSWSCPKKEQQNPLDPPPSFCRQVGSHFPNLFCFTLRTVTPVCLYVCIYTCVLVRVCEKGKEREREKMYAYVCSVHGMGTRNVGTKLPFTSLTVNGVSRRWAKHTRNSETFWLISNGITYLYVYKRLFQWFSKLNNESTR